MDVLHLTAESFKSQVIDGKQTALVDFFATWCGPCKMLAPVLEAAAKETHAPVIIGKLDIDECAQIASEYEVMSVPTLILFKDGKPEKTVVGVQTKQALLQLLSEI